MDAKLSDGIEFLDHLERMRRHTGGGQRAPHKPLLVLFALAELLRGHDRIFYRDAYKHVRPLLFDHGQPGTRGRVSDPFFRLTRDGFWTFDADDSDRDQLVDQHDNAKHAALFEANTAAGFDQATLQLLRAKPLLIFQAVTMLLGEFPADAHVTILTELGFLVLPAGRDRSVPDPDVSQTTKDVRCSNGDHF